MLKCTYIILCKWTLIRIGRQYTRALCTISFADVVCVESTAGSARYTRGRDAAWLLLSAILAKAACSFVVTVAAVVRTSIRKSSADEPADRSVERKDGRLTAGVSRPCAGSSARPRSIPVLGIRSFFRCPCVVMSLL